MTTEKTSDSKQKTSLSTVQKNTSENQATNSKRETKRKKTDPSSANGSSYPVPSFFEHRVKPKEHDSL